MSPDCIYILQKYIKFKYLQKYLYKSHKNTTFVYGEMQPLCMPVFGVTHSKLRACSNLYDTDFDRYCQMDLSCLSVAGLISGLISNGTTSLPKTLAAAMSVVCRDPVSERNSSETSSGGKPRHIPECRVENSSADPRHIRASRQARISATS